jgi:phage head maturation protease
MVNADRSVRELKEVQLFDVSVVTFPAYEETVAELRNNQALLLNVESPATIAPTSLLRLRKSQIAVEKLRSR